MQGEITGTIIGVDAVVVVAGTNSQVRRIMKVAIKDEDIEWTQDPNDNPTIAALPFEQIFFTDMDIGTAVEVDGPVLVRRVVPESERDAFDQGLKKLNTRILGALRKWINHYGYKDHRAALEATIKDYLADRIPMPTMYDRIQLEVFGPVNQPPLKMKKLRDEVNHLLAARWAVVKTSQLLLWFEDIDTFSVEGSATPQDDGPLEVIHLDNGSIDDYWQKWLDKTKA
ncbi:hypothetical protein [Lacticaseibacillus porcinae]|uniref:hypothetical protein n=1 Tax=Lacticaseibacillus porcinae TaxID=1123687 RepID=UPI000F77CBD1|nr:hypothetical protein [Lacticaseibacillus porcinae]